MTHRRVWAPRAALVELVVGGERRAMHGAGGGWWTAHPADADDLRPGDDYAFALDGGEPLPDPRAEALPHGVHGPARVVDHDAFAWHDRGWQPPTWRDAVVYELHVGTFSPEGTFDGAAGRLGHLAGLGVTHVEVMPVNAFPGARGWGYDGVGLFAPQEAYGGVDGFKRFVDAAHGHGLAVLLDVVYNHFGPDGNYLPRFGPYLTERHGTPWGAAVNLDDAGSHEVRRFICDNAIHWLRQYHLDGLRLDAADRLIDQSAIHLLEQLAAETRALADELGRSLVLVAESDLNDPRLVRPVELGGFGLDASWSDDFHHALHTALTGERGGYYRDFDGVPDLVRALERVYVYDGRYSPNRDRIHGRPVEGLGGDRFVVFAQNHDQIGNRARGDRLAALVEPDALRVAAALVLTGPFVPLLFQGEEWAASTPFLYFSDHQDPALARAVREGRRAEFAAFGWDPEEVPDPGASGTFEASRLRWDELDRPGHRELLDWHRRLLGLRRERSDLRDGRLPHVRHEPGTSAIAVERLRTTIAANLGQHAAQVRLGRGEREVLLASSEGVRVGDDAVTLPPLSCVVLEARR